MEKLLNTEEVKDILGISYRRLMKYIAEDDTFPARKIGGAWKVRPSELNEWIEVQPTYNREVRPSRKAKQTPRKLSSENYQVRIPI